MNQWLIDKKARLDRLFDAEYGPEHSGIGGEYAGRPDRDVLKTIAPEEAMLFTPTEEMLAIQQHLYEAEKTQKTWVYFLRGGPFMKIGRSEGLRRRLYTIQTGSPLKLCLCAISPPNFRSEDYIHNELAEFHYRGEWFWYTREVERAALSYALRPPALWDLKRGAFGPCVRKPPATQQRRYVYPAPKKRILNPITPAPTGSSPAR